MDRHSLCRRTLSLVLLLAAVSGVRLDAQVVGAYRFELGDTMRYRETSRSESRLRMAQGEIAQSSEHDATIALTSSAPGTLLAWYESLAVSAKGPTGSMTPNTDAVLGETFRLAASPLGGVRLETAPEFPEDIVAVTDLTHQFDDFLITVPATRPGPGATWQDTIRSESSDNPDRRGVQEAVRSYRVRGDTVFDGRPAMVIEVSMSTTMNMSAATQGRMMTMVSRMSGDDSGLAIFDWDEGRLLFRSKNGTLTGTVDVRGAQTMRLPQTISYTSSIQRVR